MKGFFVLNKPGGLRTMLENSNLKFNYGIWKVAIDKDWTEMNSIPMNKLQKLCFRVRKF